METTEATQQLSSRELYTKITTRLQSMANEEDRIRSQPNEAIFLDDMLLRLERWCAYVDKNSFDWADKIHSVGDELIALLLELSDAVQRFDEALDSTIGQEPKDIETKGSPSRTALERTTKEAHQKRLQDAIEKLTSYTSPLKAIGSIPPSERTNVSSTEINSGITRRQSELESKIIPNAFFLIDPHAAPKNAPQSLLGAIVLNPSRPFEQLIPADEDRINDILGSPWKSITTTHNFNMVSERVKSASVKTSITAALRAARIPINIGASVERSTQSRESFEPVKLTRYTIENPTLYAERIVDRNIKAIKEWKGSSMYVVVQVITIGDDDVLFAAKYRKVTWKRKYPWKMPEWKIEEANRGEIGSGLF